MIPNNISVLYLSYPISWFVTATVQFACAFFVLKKLKKQDIKTQETLA